MFTINFNIVTVAFYPRDVVSAVYLLRQRGWVAGWLSVTAGSVTK